MKFTDKILSAFLVLIADHFQTKKQYIITFLFLEK